MIQSIVCTLVTNVARQAMCSPINGSELTQAGRRKPADRREGRASARMAVGGVTVLMADSLGGALRRSGCGPWLCGWRPFCGAGPVGGAHTAFRNVYAFAVLSGAHCVRAAS